MFSQMSVVILVSNDHNELNIIENLHMYFWMFTSWLSIMEKLEPHTDV